MIVDRGTKPIRSWFGSGIRIELNQIRCVGSFHKNRHKSWPTLQTGQGKCNTNAVEHDASMLRCRKVTKHCLFQNIARMGLDYADLTGKAGLRLKCATIEKDADWGHRFTKMKVSGWWRKLPSFSFHESRMSGDVIGCAFQIDYKDVYLKPSNEKAMLLPVLSRNKSVTVDLIKEFCRQCISRRFLALHREENEPSSPHAKACAHVLVQNGGQKLQFRASLGLHFPKQIESLFFWQITRRDVNRWTVPICIVSYWQPHLFLAVHFLSHQRRLQRWTILNICCWKNTVSSVRMSRFSWSNERTSFRNFCTNLAFLECEGDRHSIKQTLAKADYAVRILESLPDETKWKRLCLILEKVVVLLKNCAWQVLRLQKNGADTHRARYFWAYPGENFAINCRYVLLADWSLWLWEVGAGSVCNGENQQNSADSWWQNGDGKKCFLRETSNFFFPKQSDFGFMFFSSTGADLATVS